MAYPWEDTTILRDRLGAPIPQAWDSVKKRFVPYERAATQMDYYGATIGDRPAANAVPVGAVFMAVQTQEIWQTDGTSWVVI